MARSYLTMYDLSADETRKLLARSAELKALRGTPKHPQPLAGKSIAILLEKASTRTRISFEVGIHELGAFPVTLISKDTQMGRGEPLEDTARMLNGYVHGAVFRTHAHGNVETLAQHAEIPVINGLTDLHHPCQVLADLLTVQEAFGELRSDLKVAWIGDGNNMAHSWITAAALLGFELRLACPPKFQPNELVIAEALARTRGKISIVSDPAQAVKGAHVVTTDVWSSMGQEQEAQIRKKAFAQYTVNEALMKAADKDAIFLHCLPAHRGEEVAAAVIDGSQSRVWDEAENRLHTQKALLELLVC